MMIYVPKHIQFILCLPCVLKESHHAPVLLQAESRAITRFISSRESPLCNVERMEPQNSENACQTHPDTSFSACQIFRVVSYVAAFSLFWNMN